MEPSIVPKGHVFPTHEPSKQERELIMEQTGNADGDFEEKKKNPL